MYLLKHILLALIPGIILGLFGFYVVKTVGVLDGNPIPKMRAFVIISGSMEPSISVGSLVFTKAEPLYQVGDVITFQQDGRKQMVTHRIVEITNPTGAETFFITKGDKNEEVDNHPVAASNVIGKSMSVIPHVGKLVDFVKTPQGFVAFIVIPATIVVYEELKTVGGEVKKGLKRISKQSAETFSENRTAYWRTAILLPTFGAVFLLTAFSVAYFSDHDISINNVLGISTTYATPTPSPTASPSPTPSSIPIATDAP